MADTNDELKALVVESLEHLGVLSSIKVRFSAPQYIFSLLLHAAAFSHKISFSPRRKSAPRFTEPLQLHPAVSVPSLPLRPLA